MHVAIIVISGKRVDIGDELVHAFPTIVISGCRIHSN